MKQRILIIPTTILLLVSLILVTTATYAWFSINNDANATGMQVKVKSSSTFLLISAVANGDTPAERAEYIQQAGNHMPDGELDFAMDETEVYPCKPIELTDVGDGKLLSTLSETDIITVTTAGSPNKWYTAQSNDPTSSTNSVSNAHTLAAANFDEYVIHQKFYLTVAEGANDVNGLTVKPTITAADGKDISAVKVLLVTDDNIMVFLDSKVSSQVIQGANTLTEDTVRMIDVYIYYDGSEDVVSTSNIANLDSATISLEFKVTPISE